MAHTTLDYSTILGTLKTLLQSNMEPTEPADTILAYFREHTGKQWTVRHLNSLKIRAKCGSLRIRQIASMTSLVWGGYGNDSDPRPGGSLLIAYKLTGITIDPDFLLRYNGAYFGARDQRNEARQACLDNPAALDTVADLIERGRRALVELEAVAKQLDGYVGFGQLFNPDQYTLERLAGVNDIEDYVKKQNGGDR